MLKMITAAAAVIGLSATQLAAENYNMVDYYMSAILPSLQFKAGGKLKKTGQTVSYDADGNEVTKGSVKDDGYYQAGVAPSYTRNADKDTVMDKATGLMWQDNAAAASTTATWQNAIYHCSDLDLGGYSDWRLPSIEELETIVNDGRYSPAINIVFAYTASGNYWSSSAYVSYTNYMWFMDFEDGRTDDYYKTSELYVRCVRGRQ